MKFSGKDLVGLKFNRWTVLSFDSKSKDGDAKWFCRCECGVERPVSGRHLRAQKTKSCGCYKEEKRLKHGQHKSITYSSWVAMRQRCLNPETTGFARWGGRGITICARWGEFKNFLEDMGERPSKEYSLDRINNNGNYEPGNCRWATRKQQIRNSRTAKIDETTAAEIRRLVAFNSYSQIAEGFGISNKHVGAVVRGESWNQDKTKRRA